MQISKRYEEEIINEIKDLSDEQTAKLMRIIHIFKESIIHQRELDYEIKKEFEEWGKLSDEALLNFEDNL
jgi:hypothetical protein